MKKKNYITPAAKEVTLLAMQMMASSPNVYISNETTVDDASMSNSRRDGWSDPWN